MSPPSQVPAPRAATDWPEAAHMLNEKGSSPIVLICEHASNYIPTEYERLGLNASDLREHIAWDIGAAELTRALAGRLDAVAFLAGYSRLLIDLNRPLGAPTSIPLVSEATRIPGNYDLPQAEVSRRVRLIFNPFHERIAGFIRVRRESQCATVIVAIHSFSPVFHGEARPFHVGVLFDKSSDLALRVLGNLRTHRGVVAEANVPYHIHPDEDYAIPVHGTRTHNPALLIEVRNDGISHSAGVSCWTDRLAEALVK